MEEKLGKLCREWLEKGRGNKRKGLRVTMVISILIGILYSGIFAEDCFRSHTPTVAIKIIWTLLFSLIGFIKIWLIYGFFWFILNKGVTGRLWKRYKDTGGIKRGE